MKTQGADGVRGGLMLYLEGDLLHIFLGTKEDPESELVTSVNKHYLKDFIALLRVAQDKYERA
jgi:hypothetical protein